MKRENIPISLIITTYNNKNALELVLLSVIEQNKFPFEVIIADDGSKEDTAKLIESLQVNFPIDLHHCWQTDDGFRVSQIRNKAFAIAKGDYIIMIDGDVVLHPNFIRDHNLHIAKNQFIQGSRVLLSKEPTDKALLTQRIKFSPFSKGIINRLNAISSKSLSGIISKLYSTKQTHANVRSCNMSCWKEDLVKVNGFNEEFVGWGREDSEFAVRLLNNGIRRLNLKFGAVVYHLWHNENKKDDLLKNNDILLEKTISQKLKSCSVGLNQYK